VGVAISGYANITSGMDGLNDALYSVGPISVSIDATPDSFYYYQGEKITKERLVISQVVTSIQRTRRSEDFSLCVCKKFSLATKNLPRFLCFLLT